MKYPRFFLDTKYLLTHMYMLLYVKPKFYTFNLWPILGNSK